MMDQANKDIIRPLIYADIDLNLIDGSAVWVASIVETLAQDDSVKPMLLLKRPILRDVLTKSLQQKPNVSVINPWSKQFRLLNLELDDDSWIRNKSLSITQAVEIMEQLDQTCQYDMFLVRGYPLSREIVYNRSFANRTWFYITDFPQQFNELAHTHLEDLTAIYNNGDKLLCQTPTLIEYFKKLLNTADDHKFIYLPPMVPNYSHNIGEFRNKNNRLIYAGKFSPLWMAPEMFEAFKRVQSPSLEFVVAGDKFHNSPFTENYSEKVKDVLKTSSRIVWKKGFNRSEVQQLIINSDVGVSWRHTDLDESKELSTKVLEYGLHGKPVIMNRNELHESVFGKDYPLYANSETEFIEKIKLVFEDPFVYEKAARSVYEVSRKHTFAKVYEQLKPYIEQMKKNKNVDFNSDITLEKPINLLFAGHDLKFSRLLIDYFKNRRYFKVKEDKWNGHNSHDELKSRELLAWADVVIAEWGLGNAVWYSKHKKKGQKLIVRMHLQEKNTPFPHEINWQRVDHLIFISPGLKKEMEQCFKLPYGKTSIYYNLVDTQKMNLSKLPGSNFNLGIMGIVPMRKRLDMAIDIFESLWHDDPRYTLFVKGLLPNEYPWLWKREKEKDYYHKVFKRINRSPWRNAVVFDGWGKDIPEWFRKIGFVLSPSDFESFHMAVAEGMASGTIPIIRNWHGSSDLYPREFIFSKVEEAASLIRKINENDSKLLREKVKSHVSQFDKHTIGHQWEDLIVSLYSGKKVEGNISRFS